MQSKRGNFLPTNDLAKAFGVSGNTIRRSLCVKGHYMGIRPIKLPNKRLLWPAEAAEKILSGTKRESTE